MSFNAKDMTQGGQIASMRIRMFSQIANIMLYCLFIFFWILVGLVLWVKISWQTFVNGCIYWWCTTLEGMRDLIKSQPVYEIQYYGKTFRMNAAQVLHDKYMIWCGEQLWSAFVLATVVALVICLITFFVVSWILGRQGKQQSENEVTGGRQLTDNPKDVARMLKKDGKDSDTRVLSDNESKVFFEKVKGQYPEMDIKIPFLTVMETLQYKPAESAAKVQCPVLIVIAGQDSVNPPEQGKALYDAVASGTKELYEEADACHYDIYEGAFFERVAAVQTQWFKKHL